MEEEEEEEEDDDDEVMSERVEMVLDDAPGPSSPTKRSSLALYSRFINKIVTDAMIVIWPENTAMVLARFLADKHQYSALQVR